MKLNRVMMVTGEHTQRHLLSPLLECLGYSCRKTSDVDKAIQQLHQYPADIILLDHNLPEIDGLSVLQKFVSEKNIGDPTIVILKSAPIKGFEDQALQFGAHAVISNSSSFQTLLSAINPDLSKKKVKSL